MTRWRWLLSGQCQMMRKKRCQRKKKMTLSVRRVPVIHNCFWHLLQDEPFYDMSTETKQNKTKWCNKDRYCVETFLEKCESKMSEITMFSSYMECACLSCFPFQLLFLFCLCHLWERDTNFCFSSSSSVCWTWSQWGWSFE